MSVRRLAVGALCASALLPPARPAAAEGDTGTQKRGLTRAAVQRLSPHLLSAAGRNLQAILGGWDRYAEAAASPSPALITPPPAPLAGGRVTDPLNDMHAFNPAGLNAQSQSSTAWCGNVVIVAYNDLQSLAESQPDPGGQSLVGISRSTDGGLSYSDMGFLPVPDPDQLVAGDPIVACTDGNNFYLAAMVLDLVSDVTSIALFRSTDGGLTWGAPTTAASASSLTNLLDRPWLAVDRDNGTVHVTYTNFDSGSCSILGGTGPMSIRYVRSTDGGTGWSAPRTFSSGCASEGGFVHGSQVLTGASGPRDGVFVAWLRWSTLGAATAGIVVRRSTDDGATFPPGSLFAGIFVSTPGAKGFRGNGLMQGGIVANAFPMMAVDRTTGPRRGTLYIAWTDGSASVSDVFGIYGYADIRLARSVDAGLTWSRVPSRVNTNLETTRGFTASYTDQFFPAIAVDRTGEIGVCFYDRRRDRKNFRIDRVCATSVDGGATWLNDVKTRKPFTYGPDSDAALALANELFRAPGYIDYDTLASDSTLTARGFRGAFMDASRGNLDLKSNRP